MKHLKTIIIAGIVLLVFIIATVVIVNIPQTSTSVEETSEEESTSSETVYVIKEEASDLVSYEIVPTERSVDDDTAYTYASESMKVDIEKTTDDNGSTEYSYTAEPDPGEFDYDTSMFRSMMYTLSSISAINLVEEDAQDLTIYGLDEPTCIVKTWYADGREIDLIVGSMAPVDENYYCMTSESNTVYTIGSYVDSLLCRRPIEYRDITLFPTYEDDDIYTNIDWVKLTNRDGSEIEILLDSNLDNEYNTEQSQYVMLQPYQVSGNTSTIESNILDVVATLTLGSIIDDISEDEYGAYGLNNPAKLEMTDISGNSVSLLVGNVCPNSDYTYCMLEGTHTLICASTTAFDWIGTSYVQYMLRTVWTFNIEDLESIQFDIDGDVYDMQVEHYIKQNANGNDTDGVTGTLNGQEIIETNVRRLFIRALYFRIIDNLTEDEKAQCEGVEPYATVTINLTDEDPHVLELIPLTDRKYAMRVDGELEYYCYKKSLTTLTDSLGWVLSGDELSMNFD